MRAEKDALVTMCQFETSFRPEEFSLQAGVDGLVLFATNPNQSSAAASTR